MYDRVRDELLTPLELSEEQVQVVWLKNADPLEGGEPSLPSAQADAYQLMTHLGNIVRALDERYPNLQQVYISSRIYAGYANREINPEPYAYESGFAVKWLIESQINQMAVGEDGINPIAGDLNYETVAPWIAWGPYLWADGANPRSDGLVWLPEDYGDDGTHPSNIGREKVAELLLNFFKTEPTTQCWFLADADC
jgi:lysophospholipase L1-like esterase